MKENIIGRTNEIERIDRCMGESSAQLIIVYGRRRVGKTFLINEYFDNNFSFKITGAYKKSRRFQLEGFNEELIRKSGREWDMSVQSFLLCCKLFCFLLTSISSFPPPVLGCFFVIIIHLGTGRPFVKG